MNKKVLYVYGSRSSFIAKDIQLLKDYYTVEEFKFNKNPKYRILFSFVKQFFQLITHLKHYDAVFIMFAGYQSFIPSVINNFLRAKIIIIAGGTDCVSFPSINYGNFRKPLLRYFTSASYQNCDLILPVDDSLVFQNYTYQNNDADKQGIKAFLPNLKTPIEVVYNGYSSNNWKMRNNYSQRTKGFITVASVQSINRLNVKGLDLIIYLAKEFPHETFTIVGLKQSMWKNFIEYSNIIIKDKVSKKELETLYNDHKFYLQLSISEGFPNAISEAMLCGCIPIGSHVGAIPNIVGNTGHILDRRSHSKLKSIINKALADADNETRGILARQRIAENFNIERRQLALKKAVIS